MRYKLLLGSIAALSVGCSSVERDPAEDYAGSPAHLRADSEILGEVSLELRITTPPALSPLELGVATTQGLIIKPGARVRTVGSALSTVSNLGEVDTLLEPRAEVGTVFSGGKLILKPHATVLGVAHARAVVTEPHASIMGGHVANPELTPERVTSLAVVFPAAQSVDARVGPHATGRLEPGRYRKLDVGPHATLVLGTGAYFLDEMSIGAHASIRVDDDRGPVFVFVRRSVSLHGRVGSGTGAVSDFVFAYAGERDVLVHSGFDGTIVAPNAAVKVSAHRVVRGAIFSKSLILGPESVLEQAPANALLPLLFPSDLQECSEAVRTLSEDFGEADFQAAIARYCSMPGESRCLTDLVGRANSDYTAVALQLVQQQVTPSHYLAVVRARTREMRGAEDDPERARELCVEPDSDGDWVPDHRDNCPNTADLAPTDEFGCPPGTLPEAPAPELVRDALAGTGMMFNPECSGATVPPQIAPGAFYRPAAPERGTYIFAGRVRNQPAGCPVWYQFHIQEYESSAPPGTPPISTGTLIREYMVAFMENEELTALVGSPRAVPEFAVQFNPLPTDPGTRGTLGSIAGQRKVHFRVRAMNGNGIRGPWSVWKSTRPRDCLALGFRCGG